MPTAVIIDDQSTSRMIMEQLVRSLEAGIDVRSFESPVEALRWVKNNPTDLVLTDYKMPVMDGAEFTQWLRKIPACADIPVIVITGVNEKRVRYRALAAGATDFLTKPIDHHECRARCRNLLTLRRQQKIIKERARWLERQVNEAIHEVRDREKETLLRLARAGEYRDEGTGNHVVRMAKYSRVVAEQLGLDDDSCDVIEKAAPMHDIGKIGIPDRILLMPGKLDAQDWEVMKTHVTIGYEILRDSPSEYLRAGALIALRHHERFDGSGYPDGLAGEDIPLLARIVAVADVYDALLSERPYKPAWSMQQAIDYLTAQKGRHFDPSCVEAFVAKLDRVDGIRRRYGDDRNLHSR